MTIGVNYGGGLAVKAFGVGKKGGIELINSPAFPTGASMALMYSLGPEAEEIDRLHALLDGDPAKRLQPTECLILAPYPGSEALSRQVLRQERRRRDCRPAFLQIDGDGPIARTKEFSPTPPATRAWWGSTTTPGT